MTVAVDIEAYDPGLLTKGDGSLRSKEALEGFNDGSRLLMCAWFDGKESHLAYPGTESWGRLKRMLADPEVDKAFHNSVYDLSWLMIGCGLEVNGDIHDTMTRAAYIDEYQDLTLDACCRAMKVKGKNKGDTIEAWYREHIEDVRFHCFANARPFKRSDALWKHTPFLLETFSAFRERMEEYNRQDAKATWELYMAQEPLMRDFMEPYMVDTRLIPLVMDMKRKGILVDRAKLEALSGEVRRDFEACMARLEEMYGIDAETLASPKKLGARMNQMGVHSPLLTENGAESWAQGALTRMRHPAIPLILEARGYSKLLNTYLEGSLKDAIYSDGRIHCTFTPNKRDDGGTVTGRFSCSKPNLQQIPAREKAVGHSYAQAMRSLFLPEEGCMISALDYSQIEYLLLAHFAVGPQAEWLREQALSGVDFHDAAMAMTGIKSRKAVKAFNYGVMYGMGWETAMMSNWTLFDSLARESGVTIEKYTKSVYEEYHRKLPVIRATSSHVQNMAKSHGFVTTLGGRRLHQQKAYYNPKTRKWNDSLYKMLNKLIQGSAADVLKFSLLEAYKAGVFNTLAMHLTVHDENVVSVPYNREGAEANAELKRIMESAFHDRLKVPMKCDCELGPDWGYWESDIWEEMRNGRFDRAGECWWGRRG